jgi:hypothetical protein
LKVPGWTEEQFSTFTDEFASFKNDGNTGAINVRLICPRWEVGYRSGYGVVDDADLRIYPGTGLRRPLSGLVGLQIQDDAAIAAYREELKNLDAFSAVWR